MDSDDAILNPFLLEKIYNFNKEYQLDLIEFILYYEEEGKNNIYIPDNHQLNHFHNFSEKLMFQPSTLLFFEPNSLKYSDII